jgi:hypothetical protein
LVTKNFELTHDSKFHQLQWVEDFSMSVTTRIDASSLGAKSLQDDDNKPQFKPQVNDDEEDWGAGARSAAAAAKPVLETPKTSPVSQTENTLSRTETVDIQNLGIDEYLALRQRMAEFESNMADQLQDRLTAVNQQQEADITALVQKHEANVATIKAQLAQLGKTEVSTAPAASPAASTATSPAPSVQERPHTSALEGSITRRTRPKNEKKLAEVIMDILHEGKRFDLKTLSEKVVTAGYKSSSNAFATSVRQALYKLENEEIVAQFEGKTFGLIKGIKK